MANVIKHKRGSGSDPSASNLVVGELAIRTDNGKLFTKMDSGAIAEIAGGGSDIAINTLSSSSATGGGSATFNGSAYRFTLSSPPSVSAAQLLVSVNGVIQKPVAGTGQPSEGFSVDGNDIIFGDAPATGADFFILTFRSLGVSEPAANSVTNAKVASNAAIAGTKISPDFGSQNITTTGNLTIDTNTLHVDSSNNRVGIGTTSPNTKLEIEAVTTNVLNLTDGQVQIVGNNPIAFVSQSNLNPALNRWGFRVLAANVDGNFSIFDYRNTRHALLINSSGNIGIGTTSPACGLHIDNPTNGAITQILDTDNSAVKIVFRNNTETGNNVQIGADGSNLVALTSATERMRITSGGKIISTLTSPNPFNTIQTNLELVNGAGNQGAGSRIDFSCGSGKAHIQSQVTGGNSNSGLSLIFATSPDANGADERMRINTSGDVLIGAQSTSNAAAGSKFFEDGKLLMIHRGDSNTQFFLNKLAGSSGTVATFAIATATKGSISVSSTGATYAVTSDYRLKENVVSISDGITKLKQLLPKRFNFIADETNTLCDGFLAHEVSSIVPNAVTGEKDAVDKDGNIEPQQIDTSKLVPLLVAALQEAIGRIEVLEAK